MLSRVIKFDEFTAQARLLFNIIGMEPFQMATAGFLAHFWDIAFFLIIANLNVVLLGEVVFEILAFGKNSHFIEATFNLSFAGYVLVANIKVWNIWLKRAQLTQLVSDLSQLFPVGVAEQQNCEVAQHLQRYKCITYPYVGTHVVLVWAYNCYRMGVYLLYRFLLNDLNAEQLLPYFIWVPWQWRQHWSFYALYVSEILAGHTCFLGQLASDVLLCVLATQISMHFRYLAKQIRDHVAGASVEQNVHAAEDMLFMSSVIEYHQKILSLSAALNDIFGSALFCNFLFASLNICFIAFQVQIDANRDILGLIILYLLLALVQVFIIASYSQQLILASTNVGHAIFQHNWYDADVRYQRMLPIIIQRCQRPVMLQATNILFISLGTVTDVIQISYKLFTVLRTMYAE